MKLRILSIQIFELTMTSLKSRYRKTLPGFIWLVVGPLMLFGAQSLVFKRFLNLQLDNYYLFLLSGLLPWIFFSKTIQMGTPLFVNQSHLLNSFKFNPLVILCAQVLDNFINFLASFIIILIPIYLASGQKWSLLALFPIALIPLFIGTLSLTLILATLNVFFRDINFITNFTFSILFFLTPIFFPRGYVPLELRWIIDYNPLVYYINPFRSIFQSAGAEFWSSWFQGFGFSLLFAGLALLVWKRNRNEFYRRL